MLSPKTLARSFTNYIHSPHKTTDIDYLEFESTCIDLDYLEFESIDLGYLEFESIDLATLSLRVLTICLAISATSLCGPIASWTRTFHTVIYTLLKVVPARVELE